MRNRGQLEAKQNSIRTVNPVSLILTNIMILTARMMDHLSVLVAFVGCCLLMVSVEATVDAEQEYKRLFAHKGKAGQPSETLRDLRNLANMMKDNPDDASMKRLEEVEQLVKLNDISCDEKKTAMELERYIDKYAFPGEEVPSIRAYLKDLRAEMFTRCYPLLVDKMHAALESFAKKQSHPLISRFQKFIAANTYRLPRRTHASDIKRQLLDFIAKEYGGEHLNPKMKQKEFEEKFNKTLGQVCSDIKKETAFTFNNRVFFSSRKISAQMDSQLRDMHRMYVICLDFYAHPEELPQVLYEKLTR